MAKIKEALKEIQDAIDLSKRFPGYFDKRIFRGVVIIMLLFTFIVFWSENFQFRFIYAECNKDVACNNPFYICPKGLDYTNPFLQADCMPIESVPKELIPLCNTGVCYNQYLEPHQVIGHKPNALVLWYNQICLLMVALGFLINHLKYKWGLKK